MIKKDNIIMLAIATVILIVFVNIAGSGNVTKQKENKSEINQTQKTPKRVVAVWQNSIETLLELGLADNIIAANGLPDKKYLKESIRQNYEKIPNRSFKLYDVETIMMMKPDFILGWESTFRENVMRSTEFWNKRGVRTYIAQSSRKNENGHKIEDEYKYIEDLGQIFKVEKRAKKIVDTMKNKIKKVKEETKNEEKQRVLIIEFLGKTISSYNEKTLAGDIVKSLEQDLISPKIRNIGKEDIIKYDPDIVFVVIVEREYDQKEQILDIVLKESAFKNLKCVKNKRVYAVPLYAVYSSGSRTLDGIEIFSKGLHPKLYDKQRSK